MNSCEYNVEVTDNAGFDDFFECGQPAHFTLAGQWFCAEHFDVDGAELDEILNEPEEPIVMDFGDDYVEYE